MMAFNQCPLCDRKKASNLWGLTFHIEVIHKDYVASRVPVVTKVAKRLVDKEMSLETATAILSVAFKFPNRLLDVQSAIDERHDWKRSSKLPSTWLSSD